MSTEVWVAIASIVGAGLFAAAGYLFALWMRRGAHAAPELEMERRATGAEEELARHRRDASELLAKLGVAGEERQRALAAAERERAAAQALEARLSSTELERAELERALAEARKKAAPEASIDAHAQRNDSDQERELARVKKELIRIKGERDRALAESSKLKPQIDEAREAKRLLEQERDRSARELRAAVERLEQIEASSRERQSREREGDTAIDALRSEISVREEQATRLRNELEASRQEAAGLRRDLNEMKDLRGELLAAKNDIAALRAHGFRASVPPIVEGAVATMDAGLSYQELVDRFAIAERAKSAAITDDMGFVVAGTGEHAEELAAFGVFIAEAGARAAEFFPMHELRRITVEDAFGVCLTARPMEHRPAEVELMLVTLGLNPQTTIEDAARQQ